MCYHAWLIFIFLVETGFYHVGQAGLELLSSGDWPTSASQSAGITGVSYRTRLSTHFPFLWFIPGGGMFDHMVTVCLAFVSSFSTGSPAVAHAGVQWYIHGSQ